MNFKKEILKLLKGIVKADENMIEVPPDSKMGDYALPCFSFAKEMKKNPVQIAVELVGKVKVNKKIVAVKNVGPYLNFFVNKGLLAEEVLDKVMNCKGCYGSGAMKKEVVLVESPGPNTNKPLHLGHLRNMSLGISLAKLFKFLGFEVHNVDVVNDRGIHICKSMLAYQKYGKGKDPDKKSDYFVGDYYVLFNEKVKNNPELEKEAFEMLEKWEAGDKEVRTLSKKMNKWAVDGMRETFKRYGMKVEKAYFESDTYLKGKEIVNKGLKKGLFKKDEKGNVIVDLEKEGFGTKVLIRSNGTSVYITQDLALAGERYNDYKMDRMVYVVGSEQKYHFEVLFTLLKMLGFKFADKCYHFAYGMVNLPDGKMKSREGTKVDADDLIDEVINLAKKEVEKKYKKLSKKEVEKRAEIIGLGALKFFILKYDSLKDMVYNPKESISFEGETGPYVQYTYARISSILRKYGKKVGKVDYGLLNVAEELELVTMLSNFGSVVEKSALGYKPKLLAHYLIELSQKFNEYYHKVPVLKAEFGVKEARLVLISSVRQILKNGLGLLDVNVLEEM